MKKIETELQILNQCFYEMGIENEKRLLSNQFAFKDFFARSIYKQELEDGTINKYPKSYFELEYIEIEEAKLWSEREFYSIIDEWSNKIPMFKFTTLGNYILFFKSIFFKDYQLAIEIVDLKNRINSERVKEKMTQLGGEEQIEVWKSLEKYFYIKGGELITHAASTTISPPE